MSFYPRFVVSNRLTSGYNKLCLQRNLVITRVYCMYKTISNYSSVMLPVLLYIINPSISGLPFVYVRCTLIYTVDAGYKNTVGSREECSYIRYVLITGTFSMGKDRNGSHTMASTVLYPAKSICTTSILSHSCHKWLMTQEHINII